MKKIILIFIIHLFTLNGVNADIGFCDNANMDLNKSSFDEICNNGFRVNNLSEINSFSGNYIDIKSGYFGNKYTFENKINKNIHKIGYLGNKYDYSFKDIKNVFVVGYFGDYEKKEIILERSGGGSKKIITIPQNIKYSIFLEEIIRSNMDIYRLRKGVSRYQYNLFMDNLLEILFNVEDKIILGKDREELEKSIKEGNFISNLKKLIDNIGEVNEAIKNSKTYNERVYILEYYLNYE